MTKLDDSQSFEFPRAERLKSAKDINTLFFKNESFYEYPFKVIYIKNELADSESNIKVAFSAPKRNHKKAVTRNLIKRRTREAYRLQRNELINYCATENIQLKFMFIYTAKKVEDYSLIEKKMSKCLSKIQEII